MTDCAATVSVTLAMSATNSASTVLAGSVPLTSVELAAQTQTCERDVREWLINLAAAGYRDYNVQTDRFSLPQEHAVALLDKESP